MTGVTNVEFISEPIQPAGGTCDTGAMARGEPGLPGAFTWRHADFGVRETLRTWKESSREGGAAGELYLRRHCYELLMSDGSVWSIYFTRQAPSGKPTKARWFLYSILSGTPPTK